MDGISQWTLNSNSCRDIDEYIARFWKALLPIIAFGEVPLWEHELPKELGSHLVGNKAKHTSQLVKTTKSDFGMLISHR